ncbi:hypothetical protein BD779DRAFT_794496 [Infundibulicybe gibba]|nr:hypothetical protein BD779DRAFT_794496 [Infundibulicybe gibba]
MLFLRQLANSLLLCFICRFDLPALAQDPQPQTTILNAGIQSFANRMLTGTRATHRRCCCLFVHGNPAFPSVLSTQSVGSDTSGDVRAGVTRILEWVRGESDRRRIMSLCMISASMGYRAPSQRRTRIHTPCKVLPKCSITRGPSYLDTSTCGNAI